MTELGGLIDQIPLPWHEQQWQRLMQQAEKGQLAHAYLAAGAAGLGKYAFVQQFARYLLCQKASSSGPCGQCKNCLLGSRDQHPDLFLLQPEEGARDIKIIQIRELSDFLIRSSHAGGARVAIIDSAHHMNISASNALLKSLEEPGDRSYIFLVTDSPGILPATVRSRCQRIQFSIPSFDMASGWLQQHLDPRQEDPVALLAATDNRPLAALQLSRTGTLDAERDFTEMLCRLLAGEQSLAAVITAASKLGEQPAIRCLLKASTTLTRQLVNHSADSPDSIQQALQALIRVNSGRRSTIAALLRFHGEILQANRQLNSGANPNAQLLLESLLWRFEQLAAPVEGAVKQRA